MKLRFPILSLLLLRPVGISLPAVLIGGIHAAVILLALPGCRAFYENSGSRTRVGSLTAPVEISDGSDSITAKLFYSMDGADVYTRKDSRVVVIYSNTWTNWWSNGNQHLEVEVEPLCTDAPATNLVEEAAQ